MKVTDKYGQFGTALLSDCGIIQCSAVLRWGSVSFNSSTRTGSVSFIGGVAPFSIHWGALTTVNPLTGFNAFSAGDHVVGYAWSSTSFDDGVTTLRVSDSAGAQIAMPMSTLGVPPIHAKSWVLKWSCELPDIAGDGQPSGGNVYFVSPDGLWKV